MGGRDLGGCESSGPGRLGWEVEFGAFEGCLQGFHWAQPFQACEFEFAGLSIKKAGRLFS